VVDVDIATRLRGQVGPIGWLIVEAIAAHALPSSGVAEVRCSSRSLAGIVGVSKDSVARSFRALIDAGIIERVDHRDEHSGRFGSTTYRVDLAAAGVTVTTASHITPPVPPAKDSLRTAARSPGDQLSLLA
jgi:hypothetical protein